MPPAPLAAPRRRLLTGLALLLLTLGSLLRVILLAGLDQTVGVGSGAMILGYGLLNDLLHWWWR